MNLFPWKSKKETKPSPSMDAVLTASTASSDERRRAVRIETADISLTVTLQNQKTLNPKVADMSTLGIGLLFEEDFPDPQVSMAFEAPEILKGMRISALKRHIGKVTQPDGKVLHQIGFEFSFASIDQQNRLLRWLALHLQQHSISGMVPQQDASSFSSLFYSDLGEKFEIRFPFDQNEFEQALHLIGKLTVHHALIQTKYFEVLHKKVLVALIPLVPDMLSFHLLADEIFPEHLGSLRVAGRRLAEVSIPYFKEDFFFLKNPSQAHLRKLRILFKVFPYLLLYAKNFANITDLLTLAPPHLEEFYHLWYFKELGPEVKVLERKSGQIRKGFRLMRLNLTEAFHAEGEKQRPELTKTIKDLNQSQEFIKGFQSSYFPSAEILRMWFMEKNPILDHLSPDQSAYFEPLISPLKA